MKLKIKNSLYFSVFALGVTSFVAQVIILREFLSVFQGNELVIGIVLAMWMLLTGTGAFLGRYSWRWRANIKLLVILQTILAFLPWLSIFFLRTLKNTIFPVGASPGINEVIASSFVLLLPYCTIAGFMFTVYCKSIAKKLTSVEIGSVYFYETLGSAIGGLAFNFIMVYFLSPFQNLYIILLLNLFSALFLSISIKKAFLQIPIALLILGLPLFYHYVNIEAYTRSFEYPGQEIIKQEETPYGNIIVTKTGEQYNFYENGVILFNTKDVIAKEEDVHYAMIQHNNPGKVLLISGGVNGVIEEILKYDVDQVDYLEINPRLVELVRKYTDNIPKNDKLNIIYKDARIYLKTTGKTYDIALVNVPEPTTAQLNRYYTTGFFQSLKKKLQPGAVVSISLPSTGNYVDKEAARLHAVLYYTMKKYFTHVTIIPAGKNYFLASDSKLSRQVAKLMMKRNINTQYVNHYYIDDFSIERRSEDILQQVKKIDFQVNKDFKPVAYFYRLKHWVSQYNENYVYFLIGLGVVILLIVLRLNAVNLGLFTGGFAGSSLEIILILSFQVIYGYVYNIIGIIIMAFMVGLALGIKYYYILFPKGRFKDFLTLQVILSCYSIVLPLVLWLLNNYHLPDWLVYIIFIGIMLDISFMVGMEFALASRQKTSNMLSHASGIYSSDLLGSAIGALLISAFIIPLFGILNTCILIGLLNLLSASIGFLKRKHYA